MPQRCSSPARMTVTPLSAHHHMQEEYAFRICLLKSLWSKFLKK